MRTLILTTLLLTAAVRTAEARQVRTTVVPGGRLSITRTEDGDRPFLGITMSSGSKRDTLGILIASVTPGSPAEKAGLEEGNRIGAINGVSLKIAREDAGEPEMTNAMMNRLTRELRKAKVGDEVSLDIYTGGRYKTVKVKTAAADDIGEVRRTRSDIEERAVIGVSLSVTGSKRDADGVFVGAVTDGGPAEKAGIVEGERIASINGVSLRVAKEDAEEPQFASAKLDRLNRELGNVKAGDAVELQVVSGGRTRTVKVTTVKASALPHTSGYRIGFGDGEFMRLAPGGVMTLPRTPMSPSAPSAPRLRMFRNFDDMDGADFDVKAEVERALERARSATDRVRIQVEPQIRMRLEEELPRAMRRMEETRAADEIRQTNAMQRMQETMNRLRVELPARTTRRTVII
jgi:serine protease Do